MQIYAIVIISEFLYLIFFEKSTIAQMLRMLEVIANLKSCVFLFSYCNDLISSMLKIV